MQKHQPTTTVLNLKLKSIIFQTQKNRNCNIKKITMRNTRHIYIFPVYDTAFPKHYSEKNFIVSNTHILNSYVQK